MTLHELTTVVNNRYLFCPVTPETVSDAEQFASRIARARWPEVINVTVSIEGDCQDLELKMVFRSEQDQVWWNLKNG